MFFEEILHALRVYVAGYGIRPDALPALRHGRLKSTRGLVIVMNDLGLYGSVDEDGTLIFSPEGELPPKEFMGCIRKAVNASFGGMRAREIQIMNGLFDAKANNFHSLGGLPQHLWPTVPFKVVVQLDDEDVTLLGRTDLD